MKEQQGRQPGKAVVPALSVFVQFSSAQILARVFGNCSPLPGFDCTPSEGGRPLQANGRRRERERGAKVELWSSKKLQRLTITKRSLFGNFVL